jgi:hypothetical protein
MGTILWILQILLAIAFGMSGPMKAFMPEERFLADERMDWVKDVGRFIEPPVNNRFVESVVCPVFRR